VQVQHIDAVEHGQVNCLMRGLKEISKKWGRRLTNAALHRRKLAELEHAHSHPKSQSAALDDLPFGKFGE
jgi:hypothetical protein